MWLRYGAGNRDLVASAPLRAKQRLVCPLVEAEARRGRSAGLVRRKGPPPRRRRESTPVELVQPDRPGSVSPQNAALALVRSGAVYLDPAAGDVWFHPWAGAPRVVGHDSKAGPGGDPNSDIAVWFEGSDPLNATPGELVVYDTAAGREISRTLQKEGVADCSGTCGDHFPAGNGFLQVSTERVVWTSWTQRYSHDLRTRSTSEVKTPEASHLADVHDDVEVLVERGDVVLTVPGRAEQRYPELSPTSG